MKGKSTAAIVRCVTCNCGDVEITGFSGVTEQNCNEVRLQAKCWRSGCPAPEFEIVFRVMGNRTIMDVEVTP